MTTQINQPQDQQSTALDSLSQLIVVNTPGSHRMWQQFKASFPNAEFFRKATLGSKRKSYLISYQEYESRKQELKKLKVCKARNQPFFKPLK
jgi:hypothetical protein